MRHYVHTIFVVVVIYHLLLLLFHSYDSKNPISNELPETDD